MEKSSKTGQENKIFWDLLLRVFKLLLPKFSLLKGDWESTLI